MAISIVGGKINIAGSYASGTATSGTSTSITDTGAAWTASPATASLERRIVWITGGTGAGQSRAIESNTGTTANIYPTHPFFPAPDNTSTYAFGYDLTDIQAAGYGSWLIGVTERILNVPTYDINISATGFFGQVGGALNFTTLDKTFYGAVGGYFQLGQLVNGRGVDGMAISFAKNTATGWLYPAFLCRRNMYGVQLTCQKEIAESHMVAWYAGTTHDAVEYIDCVTRNVPLYIENGDTAKYVAQNGLGSITVESDAAAADFLTVLNTSFVPSETVAYDGQDIFDLSVNGIPGGVRPFQIITSGYANTYGAAYFWNLTTDEISYLHNVFMWMRFTNGKDGYTDNYLGNTVDITVVDGASVGIQGVQIRVADTNGNDVIVTGKAGTPDYEPTFGTIVTDSNGTYTGPFGSNEGMFIIHNKIECANPTHTCQNALTISSANPAIVTYTGSDVYTSGGELVIHTTGALPTAIPNDQVIYVKTGTLNTTTNTFQVALTPTGTALDGAGTQSGTHLGQTYNASFNRTCYRTAITNTDYSPYSMTMVKYGYVAQTVARNWNSRSVETNGMAVNNFVVASKATAAAYTGVSITGSAKTIVLSVARTLQELYDYSQAWRDTSGGANLQYTEPLITPDGINFTLSTGWSLTPESYLDYESKRVAGGTIIYPTAGVYAPTLGTCTISFGAVSGSYTLSSADISGTVTLVNTGGGSLTVYLPVGTSYVNTGPNITVVTGTVAISAPNLADGTKVRLYNVTDDVEIETAIVSGGAGYINNYTFVSDFTVRLDATYQNGTSAYEPIVNSTGLVTSAGYTFTDTQSAWAAYDAWGLDGSTMTEFTADALGHIEVDIDDPDGVTQKTRLGAWYAYLLTTDSGIRNYMGAISLVSAAEIVIHSAVVDLLLDNVSTTKDARFDDLTVNMYSDQGTSLVASTSKTIVLEYNGQPSVVNLATMQTKIDEIHGLDGLDAARPLKVLKDNTSRSAGVGAGSINQTIEDDGTTVTVTRV